jgi:hypothetical protein
MQLCIINFWDKASELAKYASPQSAAAVSLQHHPREQEAQSAAQVHGVDQRERPGAQRVLQLRQNCKQRPEKPK